VAAPGTNVVSAEAADSYLATTYATRHVVGSGVNAYMRLSGTSMAAGVVSGAAALMLDQHGSLKPAEAKGLLQLTSSFMSKDGLAGAGAGEMNLIAATRLVDELSKYESHDGITRFTRDSRALLAIVARNDGTTSFLRAARAIATKVLLRDQEATTDRDLDAKSMIWGVSIIWGSLVSGESIIWGSASSGDSIIWGSAASGDAIIWANAASGDSIIWGNAANGDAIIWGSAASGDSIIWGSALTD
jgi:serine protease AprX